MPIFLVFVLAAAVEISVLILVGQTIGALPTLGLLVLGAVLGSWLLRREGRRALREFNEAARARRPPERELSDGVLVVAGGLLIIVPGFVSDLAGLLCLLPPTRALLRDRLGRAARRRADRFEEQVREQMRARSQAGAAHGFPRRTNEDVIDGEVVSVTEEDDQPHAQSGPQRLTSDAQPPRRGDDQSE